MLSRSITSSGTHESIKANSYLSVSRVNSKQYSNKPHCLASLSFYPLDDRVDVFPFGVVKILFVFLLGGAFNAR